MTITFENDNDVIVYALEKVISYARRTEQLFVAQCVWWLVSIIGLEQRLIIHINNLHGRTVISKEQHPEGDDNPATQDSSVVQDLTPKGTEEDHQDLVLKECEEFLRESRELRRIAALKLKGTTRTGRSNPTPISKKALRKYDRSKRKQAVPSQTENIDFAEVQRPKEKGECLRCASPSDRKGSHRVADCRKPIKLDEGKAGFPKAKEKQKTKALLQQQELEEASFEESSSGSSSDDSSRGIGSTAVNLAA
jgi:hypothetical protein